MVVEDEPDIYEVLLAMFEMWGIEGVAFVDGEEAVAWIEDVDKGKYPGELPELALLDIRLPGAVSGPEVGGRLRQSSALENMTVVLTTAYRLSPDNEREFIKQYDRPSVRDVYDKIEENVSPSLVEAYCGEKLKEIRAMVP